MPSVFIPQSEAYPQKEWGWRGIVNPAIWNPTPPVLQGNYTWYILDKDTGYLTGVDGTRYINDEGSTGAKDGVMYSGNYLVPSASGVDYPSVVGYLVYWDAGTKMFTQVQTTAGTYNQTNPHNMTVTSNRGMTSQELDQLTNEPEMLFKVWFNNETLVDGFSKPDIVEFYPGLEQSGDYIQDLSVDLGIDIHNDTPPTVQSGDEIKTFTPQSNNDFQLEITTAGTNVSQPRVQPGLTGPLAAGTMYLISFDMDLVSGSSQIEAYWAGGEVLFAQEQLATKTFVSIMQASSTTDYYAIALNGTSLFSVNVSNWTCKEVKAIPINGATRQLNTSFGAQTVRIEQDASGRPTGFVGTHQIDFKGNNEYISTGTTVDGSISDFTMMVAFDNVLSGSQRVIVGTSGTSGVDNKLNLQIDVDGAVQAIIGKTTFDITPLIDPNLSIHAFCAIYNHQTQEVLGAADGVALQSLGTVVFDGATDAMTIGNNPTKTSPYTGKVGEVIMSDAIESEAAWLTFWGRVKVGSV